MNNSSGNSFCSFPNVSQPKQVYDHHDPVVPPAAMEASLVQETPFSTSLLYNLSMLKEKVNQFQSLVSILTAPDQSQLSIAIASMNSLVQEIMVMASSLMFVCQQMSLSTTPTGKNKNNTASNALPQTFSTDSNIVHGGSGTCFYSSENENVDAWYENCNEENHNNHREEKKEIGMISNGPKNKVSAASQNVNCDIIELDAADLLAKYTHYCQVCFKGFKRDANLRMHMRAHGDEYKTSAALTNPMKKNRAGDGFGGEDAKCSTKSTKKYSCPFEGCRWNQRHAKFQPLKSMICVKNHYKRSHCPKMYVCKRCNRKQFSVLSDLRTHEKHCGDLKWQCSCGTTFSRKDKLMGHVALFVGHAPVVANSSLKVSAGGSFEQDAAQMQVDDRG